MKTGFIHSWIGLLLCWLPVVGLLFSASGFLRVKVRLTRRHRKRRLAYLVFSFLVLVLCTGALLGEIWVYSRDPNILERTGKQVWALIVGEENANPSSDGSSGNLDGYYGFLDEGDWYADGFADLDDSFDWSAWENDQWNIGGTDAFEDGAWVVDENMLDWGDDDFWLDGPEGEASPDGATQNADSPADENLPADGGTDASGLNIGNGASILPPIE